MSTFDNLPPGTTHKGGSIVLGESHRELVTEVGGYTHPLFADAEYVRDQTPFPAALVPGELTLFLLGGLAEQTELFGEDVIALVGIDEVRFPSPALIGDTITLEMEVIDHKRRGGSTGTIDLAWRAIKQTGDVVLTCRVSMLLSESSP